MNSFKSLFVFCAFAFLSISATAQDEVFKTDVSQFIDHSNSANWTAAVEMMHPKMFKTFTKAQMIQMMNQMNAMGMKTNTTLKKITEVHPAINHDDSAYRKVDYDVAIVVQLTEQLWAQKDFILQGIKGNFGADNIVTDEAKKTLSMNGVQSMIAIKSTKEKQWKYLTYQGPQDALAKSALPSEVFDQIVK